MGAHPDGSGTGWSLVEGVDVDQPHGLDYRFGTHIAIGVRKRINKEHVAFGDTTAGGEHIPGGCAILALVDASGDITKGYSDGTYIGYNLIYDQTNNRMVCFTGDGTTGDGSAPYYLKWGPASLCLGADYTWTAAHEFDGSVDFTGSVGIDCSLTVLGASDVSTLLVEGTLDVYGRSDFSSIHATGVVTFLGSVKTTDGDGAAIDATGSTYQATSDGFLIADGSTNASPSGVITAYVGDNTTPATIAAMNKPGVLNSSAFIAFPIAKDKYFAISQVDVTAVTVRWTPFGDGSCSKI